MPKANMMAAQTRNHDHLVNVIPNRYTPMDKVLSKFAIECKDVFGDRGDKIPEL